MVRERVSKDKTEVAMEHYERALEELKGKRDAKTYLPRLMSPEGAAFIKAHYKLDASAAELAHIVGIHVTAVWKYHYFHKNDNDWAYKTKVTVT